MGFGSLAKLFNKYYIYKHSSEKSLDSIKFRYEVKFAMQFGFH